MAGVSETRTYDAVLTTTLANYRKKLYDNIFDVYPTLSWLNGKLGEALRGEKRLRLLDGGETIVEHLLYEMSSAVQSYSQYQSINLTPQEGMTIARYSWRQYAAAISISGFERRVNNGDAKMIDLLESKTKQAEMSLRDRLSRDVWGSNADGISLDGLASIVAATGTVGGLSATTFTWWVSTSRAGGSFVAQGLNDMRVVFNTISYGNDKPDFIVMPQAVFEFFEATLQPQERYTNTKAANTGFENLTFKAVPVLFDRDATAQQVTFLNSSYLNLAVHKDANLSTGKFIEPEDQDATSAKILFMGNLTTNNRRMHGRVTGVTA
jgi:hypothetical protein